MRSPLFNRLPSNFNDLGLGCPWLFSIRSIGLPNEHLLSLCSRSIVANHNWAHIFPADIAVLRVATSEEERVRLLSRGSGITHVFDKGRAQFLPNEPAVLSSG
jgi:hypothetical protein